MRATLNWSKTDELRAFVDEQSGDRTLYATPSDVVRDLLRQRKLQVEAAKLRAGVLEVFQDAIDGRVHLFKGSVSELLK